MGSIRVFYEQRATEYDPKERSQYLYDDRYSRVQESVVECGTGLKILDLGCGNGWLASLYSDGNEIWGVDLAELNLHRARERGIKVIQGNVETSLPFSDAVFDVVVCSEILEHLFFPEDVLRECNRVLRLGGWLIWTSPNLYNIKNRVTILLGKGCDWVEYPPNTQHIRHYSLDSMRTSLISHGFEVRKCIGQSYGLLLGFRGLKYLLFVLTLGRSRADIAMAKFRLSRTLGEVFPKLAPGLLIKAVKIR